MNSRRAFLKTSAAATAGLMCAGPTAALASEGAARLRNFGFISGIAGDAMKADWRGTLKKAAEFGFTEIEGGSNHAASPQQFLSYCKEVGIKPIAEGINFKATEDELKAGFDRLHALDIKYAVVYWPWEGGAPVNLEDCKKSSTMLNELGAKTKANGLKLLWHNHDLEFHEMEQGLPFDYLMDHTDPGLVECEMDIYWVKKGGGNPLDVLKRYSGRIPILHVKDMAPDEDFICPGRGIIDFAPIFKEADRQRIKHYFVERDNEPDGMACLQTSAEFLKSLRF